MTRPHLLCLTAATALTHLATCPPASAHGHLLAAREALAAIVSAYGTSAMGEEARSHTVVLRLGALPSPPTLRAMAATWSSHAARLSARHTPGAGVTHAGT